jgi:CRP-like cAMP-binding protein
VLYESNAKIGEAYFPTSSVVSMQCELASGACAELAVVGSEGMVGSDLFMGADTTAWRVTVDTAGGAWRLKRLFLKNEFSRCSALQGHLLRHTQALITQIAQTVVCNRHHSVTQRICRWLAGRLDRQECSELIVTHEIIAARLGVRRESVTTAAAILQRAGSIRYQRGRIWVLDRAVLEAHCCECYGVVKRESDRLLQPRVPISKATVPQSGLSTRIPGPRWTGNGNVERASVAGL